MGVALNRVIKVSLAEKMKEDKFDYLKPTQSCWAVRVITQAS